MEINEIYIQLSGKIPTNFDLLNGDCVSFQGEGEVVKIEYPYNQDGTQDKVLKIKLQDIYQLTKNGMEEIQTPEVVATEETTEEIDAFGRDDEVGLVKEEEVPFADASVIEEEVEEAVAAEEAPLA